jgi:hypothetical protein
MKRIKLFLLAPIIALLVFACRPDEYKKLGLPSENIAALAGTWKLSKVIQTDEDAARKGFPYQTMDVTSVFPYSDFRLTFNTNGNTASTFATMPGNAPKIIRLTSGNWAVDDPAYPKLLTLSNGSDTTRITLGSYPRGSSPNLKIRLERRDSASNKLLISYSYEFTKQ